MVKHSWSLSNSVILKFGPCGIEAMVPQETPSTVLPSVSPIQGLQRGRDPRWLQQHERGLASAVDWLHRHTEDGPKQPAAWLVGRSDW